MLLTIAKCVETLTLTTPHLFATCFAHLRKLSKLVGDARLLVATKRDATPIFAHLAMMPMPPTLPSTARTQQLKLAVLLLANQIIKSMDAVSVPKKMSLTEVMNALILEINPFLLLTTKPKKKLLLASWPLAK